MIGSKLAATVLSLALAFTVVGCFQHSYVIGTGAPDGEEVYRNWHHHWLFGLIQPEHQLDVEVEKYCPSGNATIENQQTFLNGLVGALIGFLYAPTTVTLLCEDGAQAQVELSSDDVAEIVGDPLFREVVAELAPERLAEAERALERTPEVLAGR